MSIAELGKFVWNHSHALSFGEGAAWDNNVFTSSWVASQAPELRWSEYGPGWYWFLVDIDLSDLKTVQRPTTLPQNGCDIGAVSQYNAETFGIELLCSPECDGKVVVYNGHEGSIRSRVRAHFALNSNKTGAIGLKHFSLHSHSWEVRLFAEPCLVDVPAHVRDRIRLLMNSKSGRCAVEAAWRAVYGWPVLCKE